MSEYTEAFARRLPWVRPYMPINEMCICALRSACHVWWSERARDESSFVTALPGAIGTLMLWANPNIASTLEGIHTTDVVTPEDVARAIVFLASPRAGFGQGTAPSVEGGRLSRL